MNKKIAEIKEYKCRVCEYRFSTSDDIEDAYCPACDSDKLINLETNK